MLSVAMAMPPASIFFPDFSVATAMLLKLIFFYHIVHMAEKQTSTRVTDGHARILQNDITVAEKLPSPKQTHTHAYTHTYTHMHNLS